MIRTHWCNLFSDDLAIDMGTCNTLIFTQGDVLVNEPSVIAVQEKTRGGKRVAAAGLEAKLMIGKEPNRIKAVMPVREGIIVDFEMASLMLRHYLRKARNRRFGLRRRILVNAPTAITPVETKALVNAIESAGASEVRLIEEPIAAALGSGLRIDEPQGSMIVDIGGGITEAAVLSLSGIVCSKTIPVAGNHMDAAIVQFIKKKYGLLIGEKSGEEIKTAIGCACTEETGPVVVKGMDLVSGIPSTREIASKEIWSAVLPSIERIVWAVKNVLGRCPPELASDIASGGIILSGGCALLKNIEIILQERVGVPVYISEDPLLTVIKGAGMALKQEKF